MDAFESWAGEAVAVETGGLRVAAHDVGSGPVATFLHGYPSSSLDVRPLLPRLGGLRVVAPDLPGFGASDKPVGHPYSIRAAADAVEAVWRHLGVDRSLLVAHDYSVSVAQELLARRAESAAPRPVEVTGVVWSNGGLWPDLHYPTPGQALLLDPDHGHEVAAAMTEELFADAIRGTWGTRRPAGGGELHDMWVALAHDGGNLQAHELLHYVADRRRHADRWRAALEEAPVRMRFVWGDLDPVSGAHVADRIAERLPRCPLDRLPDVGHWPWLEAPDEVTAAVLALSDRVA
jgi:pimeloyl-ACP methyl ester carboxylesterase